MLLLSGRAGGGARGTFTHSGGPIGLIVGDNPPGDNVAGTPGPTFTLTGVLPVHEAYAYDTSDRRVSKQVDANEDDDFTDPTDVREVFVYDGDAIALAFDVDPQNGTTTLKNRYLHGPGMDDVLAEEGTHQVTLTSTTVTLADFTSGGLNGEHTIDLREDIGGANYWWGTWGEMWVSGGEMSLMPTYGGGGWDAWLYSYEDGNTVSFHNDGTSSTPPTSGWTYVYDDYFMESGAGVSIASTTTSAWNTHWLLGDHQNSVRQVVEDSGSRMYLLDSDAFGNVTGTSASGERTRFGYTGQEYDAGTGLIYMGGRYYDPSSARMLSPDLPVEFGGDINSGRYVYNMPLDATDPRGWSANFGGSNSGSGGWLSSLWSGAKSAVGRFFNETLPAAYDRGELARFMPAGQTATEQWQFDVLKRLHTNAMSEAALGWQNRPNAQSLAVLNANPTYWTNIGRMESYKGYLAGLRSSPLPDASDYNAHYYDSMGAYARDNANPVAVDTAIHVVPALAYANPFGAITGPVVNWAGSGYSRHLEGQTLGQSIGGGLGDFSGASSIYAGRTNRDIATGQYLGLTESQQADAIVGGALSLGLHAAPGASNFARNYAVQFSPNGLGGSVTLGMNRLPIKLVPRVHGNAAQSPRTAYLYGLYDKSDNFLKWGITQDMTRRYSKMFMADKYMTRISSGPRSTMLQMERNLVETRRGPLNHEPWAGSRIGGQ